MDARKRELIESFKGGLIVSCQVQHDDPTFSVDFVVKMAKAAQWGGAVAIRANSPDQIMAIKKEVNLPVIGLYKIWHDDTDVFITPTLEAAKQVWEAGAEIIALDCTEQITHEGRPAYELLPILKKEIPELKKNIETNDNVLSSTLRLKYGDFNLGENYEVIKVGD